MSQDNNAAPVAPVAPSVTDKQIAELTNNIQTMNQSFEQRLAQLQEVILQSQRPAPAPIQQEALDPYQPDYSDKLVSKIEQRLTSTIEQRERQTLERQTALSELVNDYPELTNPQSELTKEAAKIASSLDPSLRNSSLGYKYAVREAAAKAGIVPKAKRPVQSDDFSLSSANAPAATRRKKDDEVSEETAIFAQYMGLDTSNKDLMKRIAGHSKRNFSKPE